MDSDIAIQRSPVFCVSIGTERTGAEITLRDNPNDRSLLSGAVIPSAGLTEGEIRSESGPIFHLRAIVMPTVRLR